MSNNSNRKHYYDDDAVLESIRQSRDKELRQDIFRHFYMGLKDQSSISDLSMRPQQWAEGWAALVEWSKKPTPGKPLKQPLALCLLAFTCANYSPTKAPVVEYTYQYLPKKTLVALIPQWSTVRQAIATIYRTPCIQLLRKLYQQWEQFAEDVYNDAIVALFKSLPKDKDGRKATLFTYFMGVSRMVGRRFAQKQQKQPQASPKQEEWEQLLRDQDKALEEQEEDFADVLALYYPVIRKQFHFDNEGELVTQLLGMIQENYREVITMKYLQERDYKEISEALGISEQNARTKVSRGIAQLRKLLNLHRNEN